jgi:hypothetical protein
MKTERKGAQIAKRDQMYGTQEMTEKNKSRLDWQLRAVRRCLMDHAQRIGWLIMPEEQTCFPEDVQAAARRVLLKSHPVEHLVEEAIRHLEEILALYQGKRLS